MDQVEIDSFLPNNGCLYTNIENMNTCNEDRITKLHLNIRSFQKNYEDLLLLIDDLTAK